MPDVKKGEKRNDYVSRCVQYVMKNEGLDQKAAVGKCEGMYTEHTKKHTKAWAEEFLVEKEEVKK